jgi:hypothetical protein
MNPAEKPALTIPSAPEYILDNFEHTDRIAVLVLNREFRETIQRITSAEKAASPEFQAWLRYKNANRSDIYVTWNRTGWFVLLFELQAWLGHSSPHSTQHYARISRTKLAHSYTDAAYFRRNLRNIEVLIDQEVVRNGKADSQPWRFYDLGHGYCTYDFFDQCPHRMACARCGFYRPKNSAAALFLEGKKNLLRLQQDIPLTEVETNAVEDGVNVFEKFLAPLTDVPTPAGPTPRQLQSGLVQIKPTKESRA